MIEKKSVQGINYYFNPDIEKFRYNEYRKWNRLVAEAAYLEGRGTDFPLHVIIETSSRCNLKCSFCNREKLTRPQQDMDFPMFTKIVDECSNNRVHSLSLYALGEPMLNKEIGRMAGYAKSMGIPYVDISTNGMYDMRRLLGTALNELIISVDGFKKTHEELRLGADYDRIMDNIGDFLIEKRRRKDWFPIVRMQIIDIPETHDQIEGYINKWAKRVGVVYVKTLEGMVQNLGDKMIPKEEIEKRLKNRKPCKQLNFVLTVDSNGDIEYCCHSPEGKAKLGNINDMTLQEAWAKVEPIRNAHRKGEYTDLCLNCVDYNW
jgi:radical SAM protein with 4Fe4S-binding SPASM domain